MAREPRFKKEFLDELLAGQDARMVFEQDGLLDELKKVGRLHRTTLFQAAPRQSKGNADQGDRRQADSVRDEVRPLLRGFDAVPLPSVGAA